MFSFELAYYNEEKDLIPFNEIDYQSLQSLATIEPTIPFSYIFTPNQSIIKNRIYSMINVDMDDISFCTNLWSLLKNKPIIPEAITIQNVLTVFYLCVAIKHSAFQININDKLQQIKERIVTLVPLFSNKVDIPWLLQIIFQMTGNTDLVRDITLYVSDFVSSLLYKSFPYINYKNTPIPCFSMFYTEEEVISVLTVKQDSVTLPVASTASATLPASDIPAASQGVKCRHHNKFPTIHLNHTGAKHIMICEKCAHSKKMFLK